MTRTDGRHELGAPDATGGATTATSGSDAISTPRPIDGHPWLLITAVVRTIVLVGCIGAAIAAAVGQRLVWPALAMVVLTPNLVLTWTIRLRRGRADLTRIRPQTSLRSIAWAEVRGVRAPGRWDDLVQVEMLDGKLRKTSFPLSYLDAADTLDAHAEDVCSGAARLRRARRPRQSPQCPAAERRRAVLTRRRGLPTGSSFPAVLLHPGIPGCRRTAPHPNCLSIAPPSIWSGMNRDADFAAVKAAHDNFGHLVVVINNARHGQFGFIEELSEADIRGQIETNVVGAFWDTQAASPYLREQKSRHIPRVSSIGGISALPAIGAYHASKWAPEAFSQALAREVADFGIHVTLIEPGGFSTDWSGPSAKHAEPLEAYEDALNKMQESRQPVRRNRATRTPPRRSS